MFTEAHNWEHWQDRHIFIEPDGSFSWVDEIGDVHYAPGKSREEVRAIMQKYADSLGEYEG